MVAPNSAFYLAMQAGHCPKAMALPGMAKTESIKAFCKAVQRKPYILLGSIREPSDFGIPFLVSQGNNIEQVGKDKETGSYFVLASPKWAHDLCSDKWIVVLDELTSSPPNVQSGMLRFVAEGYVGDLEIPGDVWKCALCNPPEIAANGFELEPPMANRLVHLSWEMDWDSWDLGMQNGGIFPAPRFPIAPDNWKERCGQVGALFSAFRRHKPDAFQLPTDIRGNVTCARTDMGGAYPSPRSWKIAMDCRACALATGVDPIVMLQLLEGAVGHVAHEYDTWETNLDLPDPEKALEKAAKALKGGDEVPYVHPDRPDKVIAFLGSVTAAVMGNRQDPKRYNKERWEAAIGLFVQAGRHEKDVAISCAAGLFRSPDGTSGIPQGANLSPDFMAELYPIIRSILVR